MRASKSRPVSPSGRQSELPIKIVRETPPLELLPFTDYFKGFEKVQAVTSIFGEKTDAVLGNLKVSFGSSRFMYMGISDEDGSIGVGTYHLGHSELKTLYLDVVHELFHIKQWRDDRKHFELEHRKSMGDLSKYYSSPIEIPAYEHTVREAERIGMSPDEIVEYLKLGPVPPKNFGMFLKTMELGRKPKPVPLAKLPVQINRKASVTLFPFTRYFERFEKLPAVRALLGKQTVKVLNKLKVEFVHVSFIQIFPSDEDAHLLVGVPYLKSSDATTIYLDILLCLNMLKRASKGQKAPSPSQTGLGNYRVLSECYKAMLVEARRIGMPNAKILEHFSIPRFLLTAADYGKFLLNLGLAKPIKKSTK